MAALNPQNDRIQQLIEEIDTMLEPGLWQMSDSAWKKNAQKSQKLLKRVRNFLASVGQQNLEIDAKSKRQVQEQQKLQIAPMLAQLVEPWQEEIENLQQQRQELLQEIRELERQRQYNYSLAQQYSKQEQIISEFSQALLGPVQDRLLRYWESITNLEPEKPSSTVPSEVSKQDEQLFPDRRVSRKGQEEIEEDSFRWQREAKDDPQNLKKPESSDVASPRLGDRPKLPPEGEIFPYPGYEWFDTLTEEEPEAEENVREILEDRAFSAEESGEPILLTNGKVEKLEEDEEVESLDQTILQLEEEVEETPEWESSELDQTILQLEEEVEEEDGEADSNALALALLEELDSEAKGEGQETEIESEIKLEKTETTKENLEQLSELFGELSQVEEEKSAKTKIKEDQKKEKKQKGKTEGEEQQEAKKKSAIARVEKEPFIPASADENLLPTEEPIEEEKDLELLLNEKTIEELATDLAQLEEANQEDEGNYLEDYEWEKTVIQTHSEDAEIEASFPRELLGKPEEEESENALILEVSSEEEEEVASFEDLLANISDFSKQINSEDGGEEEKISLEASEERTLEEILASLTSGDETPAEDWEDDDEDRMTIELLELEGKIKEGKKMSSKDKN